MRVDRKVWGPGPLPGSRIVLARPGDELTDEMWDRVCKAELGTRPETVETEETDDDSTAKTTPVVKKQARRRKKASG